MSKLHLAGLAMLLAALSTGARAAPSFPHAIAAGVVHSDYRLVQYGGGGGDDDDGPRRPAPNYGGGNHGNGNGNGNGAAILNGVLQGIQLMNQLHQQQQQRELQQKYNQQQLDLQRRRAIDDQNRRNRAIQDDRIRRAKQDELNKLRQQQQAEHDQLKKLEQQRQEETERLNDEKAADDQRKKQEEAARKEEKEEKEHEEASGNDHYTTGEKVDDKLENNVNIIVTIVPHDDRPPLPDIPPLPVNKDTKLPACGYVSLPADRESCTGRTASGGWLRIVSLPTTGGGNRLVCMSYCPHPPKIPDPIVVVPRHIVPDTPVVVVPRRIDPDNPVVVVPRHDDTPVVVVPTPKRLTPAVQTGKADSYTQPAPTRKLTPAVTTAKSDPYTEPEHKRPLTPAVITVKSDPYTEPEHKRPLTPAVITVKSDPYTEPEHKRPLTPAVITVKSDPYTEPEHKRPLTPAVTTAKSDPYTEPEHKRPLTPAVTTAESDPYTEPEHKRPLTPAVTTAESDPYTEPEHKQKLIPAVITAESDPYTEPGRKLTPAVNTGESEPYVEPPRHDDKRHAKRDPVMPAVQTGSAGSYIEPRSDRPRITPAVLTVTAEPVTQGELDEATPVDNGPPDSKGCASDGGRPLSAAISAPLAKFKPPIASAREVVTTAISGIPDGIGGALSAATKLIWQDDSSQKLFDAMKNYVDQVVPAAIGKYDTTQLSNDLSAVHNILSWYDQSHAASTKGQKLSELVTQLETMKPRFLNPQSPKSTLAEFVTFGTLHLSALKELYDHYDRYYPFDPKDKSAAADHQDDRHLVQTKLNDAIKSYQDHIQALRNDIIADRLNKLRVNDRGEVHSVFWSADAPDVLVNNDYYSAKDDSCDWQGPEYKDNQFAAWADVARRQGVVRAAYNKLIDELTAPIAQWKPL